MTQAFRSYISDHMFNCVPTYKFQNGFSFLFFHFGFPSMTFSIQALKGKYFNQLQIVKKNNTSLIFPNLAQITSSATNTQSHYVWAWIWWKTDHKYIYIHIFLFMILTLEHSHECYFMCFQMNQLFSTQSLYW